MLLECESYTRLAIFSASYGRTQYQSVQCPQPQGVAEESKYLNLRRSNKHLILEKNVAIARFCRIALTPFLFLHFTACLLSYATEIVIERCHGKRNCSIVANASTFANPCKDRSRVYLKVVYACGKNGTSWMKL